MPGKGADEYSAKEELENLQRVYNILVKKELGKITKEQLYKVLKGLEFPKLNMSLVEDLIWEVDEDCDGMISWEECKEMFFRVRHDKTGWEPRRLFNLIEFMMHDKDQSGSIDMDECMEILFRRFGKANLEVRPRALLLCVAADAALSPSLPRAHAVRVLSDCPNARGAHVLSKRSRASTTSSRTTSTQTRRSHLPSF